MTSQELDFEELLKQYDYKFQKGDLVKGIVCGYDSQGVMVDIGAKTIAVVPTREAAEKDENVEDKLKKGEEYGETNKLAALMTGDFYLGVDSKKQVDFYIIKGIAEELLDYLGYGNRYSFVIRENQMPDEVHPGQAALISVNNDIVGLIGRVHPALEKDAVYVMEIDLDKLLSKKVGKMKYKEISKFPSVKKDLAVVVDKNITSEEIATLIKKSGGSSLSKIEVFDVYTGKGIEENKKSIAYSLTFEKMDRTLTDEEINECLEKIIDMVSKKIGAELRK